MLIDGKGKGSLIMDPSFVEKRFFVRAKRYVLSHLVEAYQTGLRGNLLQVVICVLVVVLVTVMTRCIQRVRPVDPGIPFLLLWLLLLLSLLLMVWVVRCCFCFVFSCVYRCCSVVIAVAAVVVFF